MSPIAETTTITTIKYLGYLLFVGTFEYLNIPTQQLGFLGALMVIDFMSGIMKQYSLDPKDITSHRAWLGAVKKLGTLIIILSLGIFFKAYGLDGKEYIKFVLSIFIGAETYSIIQNIYVMRTGKMLKEYDVVSILIKKIGEMIINLIEQSLNKK